MLQFYLYLAVVIWDLVISFVTDHLFSPNLSYNQLLYETGMFIVPHKLGPLKIVIFDEKKNKNLRSPAAHNQHVQKYL